jgi:hypothetical protein
MKHMNKDQLVGAVTIALRLLLKNDAFLLEYGANERSITHKLAEYLQQLLSSHHVDCEYNRHGVESKRLPRHCRERDKDYVYPDIVVHLRGTDEDNLLVIEAKPTWDTRVGVPECDRVKLQEFTKPNAEYRYEFGLFIGFNRLAEPRLVWFNDGAELHDTDAPDNRETSLG